MEFFRNKKNDMKNLRANFWCCISSFNFFPSLRFLDSIIGSHAFKYNFNAKSALEIFLCLYMKYCYYTFANITIISFQCSVFSSFLFSISREFLRFFIILKKVRREEKFEWNFVINFKNYAMRDEVNY